MYGRYALFQIEQLRDRFQIANHLPDGLNPRSDIGSSQLEPLVNTIKIDDTCLIAPIHAK